MKKGFTLLQMRNISLLTLHILQLSFVCVKAIKNKFLLKSEKSLIVIAIKCVKEATKAEL